VHAIHPGVLSLYQAIALDPAELGGLPARADGLIEGPDAPLMGTRRGSPAAATAPGRASDVQRVAGRVQPDGILHDGVQRRERTDRGGDAGLAVELELQRHLTGVAPVEVPGQADPDGDAVEAVLQRQLDDVL
jgi:hypothetical protein